MTSPVAALQVRIAEIQALMAPTPTAAATKSANGAADFASVLAQVSAPTSPDLSQYENGRIPEQLLTSIGGTDKLAGPAANSFMAMKAAASAAGISLPVNDSYRSYDEQVEMARTKGLYSQGGLAAQPGTSNHGLGLSVDLELNATSRSWMRTNAGRYGFENDVAGEPWHWTYKKA